MQLNHLPSTANTLWQVCPKISDANNTTNTGAWRKSPNAKMVYILVIGAGGDGGTGGANGGGGGSSGGQTSVIIPAALLPDTLHYSLYANSNAGSLMIGVFAQSGAGLLTNWRNVCIAYAALGSDAVLETAGAAPGVVSATNMRLGFAGIVKAIGGHAGAAGGNNANGGAIVYPTTGLLVTGGAGGGDATKLGGIITEALPRPGITAAPTESNGSSGFSFFNGAFLPSGGGGGGGNAVANVGFCGNGGDGGIGCGGGGGGGGTGATPGVGGKGGPGLIVIAEW